MKPLVMVCSLLSLPLLAGLAAADTEPLQDRQQRFQLTLGDGWQEVPMPEESRTPLVGYRHPRSGAVLAVNRVDYPNLPAWRKKTRDDYYQQIERGAAGELDGYQRIALRSKHIRDIPTMELSFRYRDDEGERIVLMRFIFYRRYSLSMSLTMPMRAFNRRKRQIKAIRDSFEPLY